MRNKKKFFKIGSIENGILSISKFIIYIIFCMILLEIGAKFTRQIYGRIRTDTAFSASKKEIPALK